jgi:hypothetical protein
MNLHFHRFVVDWLLDCSLMMMVVVTFTSVHVAVDSLAKEWECYAKFCKVWFLQALWSQWCLKILMVWACNLLHFWHINARREKIDIMKIRCFTCVVFCSQRFAFLTVWSCKHMSCIRLFVGPFAELFAQIINHSSKQNHYLIWFSRFFFCLSTKLKNKATFNFIFLLYMIKYIFSIFA